MTTVIIDNNSRAGQQLLRHIEKYPQVAKIVHEEIPEELFDEVFQNDFQESLSASQFMAEMENRIAKW
jgi:hypothetical protein